MLPEKVGPPKGLAEDAWPKPGDIGCWLQHTDVECSLGLTCVQAAQALGAQQHAACRMPSSCVFCNDARFHGHPERVMSE